RILCGSDPSTHEVSTKGYNHLCSVKSIIRHHGLTISDLCSLGNTIVRSRIVCDHFCVTKCRAKLLNGLLSRRGQNGICYDFDGTCRSEFAFHLLVYCLPVRLGTTYHR